MNKSQRKELQKACELLEQANEIVARVKNEEQDKFDNLSEGLQQTAANAKLEDNAYFLEDIESNIEEQRSELETFIDN
ncbi:MAG TPA: hypothetical protein VGM41_08315 [Chitinophagaceae bacterium]|jgi:hypothetical protein